MSKQRIDTPEPAPITSEHGIEQRLTDCLNQSEYLIKTLCVMAERLRPVSKRQPTIGGAVEHSGLRESTVRHRLDVLHAELRAATAFVNSAIENLDC